MYNCGIYIGDRQTQEPHIKCDGCGMIRRFSIGKIPPSWFLDNKPPPAWSGYPHDYTSRNGQQRKDYCPACTARNKINHKE